MSKGINLPFDDYDFETLIVPILIIFSPSLVLAIYLGLSLSSIFGVAILGVHLIAVPLIASNHLLRDSGKNFEKDHYGNIMPTTKALIDKGGSDQLRKDRQQLVLRLTGIHVITQAQTRFTTANISRATSAVSMIKERLRDDKLVRRELKSYGFHRNIYSVKKFGVNVTTVFFVAFAVAFFYKAIALHAPDYGLFGLMAFCLPLFIYWQKAITVAAFEDSAERYAEQFFRSATRLS